MTNLPWQQPPKTFASWRCSGSAHPSPLGLHEAATSALFTNPKASALLDSPTAEQHRVVQQNSLKADSRTESARQILGIGIVLSSFLLGAGFAAVQSVANGLPGQSLTMTSVAK